MTIRPRKISHQNAPDKRARGECDTNLRIKCSAKSVYKDFKHANDPNMRQRRRTSTPNGFREGGLTPPPPTPTGPPAPTAASTPPPPPPPPAEGRSYMTNKHAGAQSGVHLCSRRCIPASNSAGRVKTGLEARKVPGRRRKRRGDTAVGGDRARNCRIPVVSVADRSICGRGFTVCLVGARGSVPRGRAFARPIWAILRSAKL